MTILVLLYVLLPLLLLLFRNHAVLGWTATHRSALQTCGKTLSLLILFLTIGGGLIACSTDRILYHDEASVLTIAAAFRHGQPMYPPLQAPVEYGLLYGPATYLVYIPPLLLGASRIGVYQAWGIFALALAILFVYLTARQLRVSALAAVTLFTVLLSPLTLSVWSIKGDIWVLLFSACGLWASLALKRWPAALFISISGAMLVNLKFPLLLLALLPCVLLWQRDHKSRSPALITMLLIPTLALLTFALPGISLSGYLNQLREASHHGFSHKIFFGNAPYFLFVLLPTFAMLWVAWKTDRNATRQWARHRAVFLLLMAATFAIAMTIGAKRGAGPWHGLAVIPPLLFLNAELWKIASAPDGQEDVSRLGVFSPIWAFSTIMLLLAPVALVHAVHRRFHDKTPYVQVSMPSVEREVLRIMQEHPHETLQMGYSDMEHYNLTFIRPVLQIGGTPLFVDPDARNEADLTGHDVTPAVLQALDTCTVDLWLVPKGGSPFSMESLYSLDDTIPPTSLYPESFQHIFLARYEPIPSDSQYFNLWTCRRTPPVSPLNR